MCIMLSDIFFKQKEYMDECEIVTYNLPKMIQFLNEHFHEVAKVSKFAYLHPFHSPF